MAKPINEYTVDELSEKIEAIKAERERTANALKRYEEELEQRKQEVPLGVPLEDKTLYQFFVSYGFYFESKESEQIFSRRIKDYIEALQKLAKGEPIDITVLLPLLKKGWVAMDKTGFWYWHKNKPSKREEDWRAKDDIAGDMVAFNIKPADDWENSLTECGL